MNTQDVETFMSVTGCDEAVAVQSLAVHGGDINRAIDRFFGNDGATVTQNDAEDMEEDLPSPPATLQQFGQPQLPFSLLTSPQRLIPPWGPAEPLIPRPFVERSRPSPHTSAGPRVVFPPDVRDVPIEWHDDDDNAGARQAHPHGPLIEEVTAAEDVHILNNPGHIDASVEELSGTRHIFRPVVDLTRPRITERHGYNMADEAGTFNPNAPVIAEVSGVNDEEYIQEQMLQAAIEASRIEADLANQRGGSSASQVGSHIGVALNVTGTAEDDDLARAVSLSLKTAQEEKALRERGEASGPEFMVEDADDEEIENLRRLALLRGSMDVEGRGLGGCSSSAFGEEAQTGRTEGNPADVGDGVLNEEIEETEEEQLLLRAPSSRRYNVGTTPSGSAALPALSVMDVLPTGPQPSGEVKDDTVLVAHDNVMDVSSADQHGANATGSSQQNGSSFPAEWGGISSEEHDEAVMLEAAIFGGLPETDMGLQFQQRQREMEALGAADMFNSRRIPQPPSPSVVAQRLIREQQDDEYLQSLAADREKELRAIQEAEERRLQEEAAAAAAEAQEKLRQEEELRLQHAQEELERQLAVKKASLPPEPASDDDQAVKLVVRMPDSSRRGRRFRKSDKLQVLFDFLDCSEDIKPGSYRLVAAYPRRVFTEKEHESPFESLGFSSKQELLNLELI